MEDFVHYASLLASPATSPLLRAAADAWLAAFRRNPSAWTVALGVLRCGGCGGGATVPPEARLQAASLLAWKAKRQLDQLRPVSAQAELAEALIELAAGAGAAAGSGGAGSPGGVVARRPGDDVALRGVCLALANLAIQCSEWERPLEALGELLPCPPALLPTFKLLPPRLPFPSNKPACFARLLPQARD